MLRAGYKLRLRWPISRGMFDPYNGDEMRRCIGFVKPWRWVINWSNPPRRYVVDMGDVPELPAAPTALYDLLCEMREKDGGGDAR